MSASVTYSERELNLISSLCGHRFSNKDIAAKCNDEFHGGRPVRTARSIEFASESKLKLSRARFQRQCDVCSNSFKTSWPQARYCSEDCKSVVSREYATKVYRANPVKNVQSQTVRLRSRVEDRWKTILAKFGDCCGVCKKSFPRIVYDLHHPNGKDSRKDAPSRVIRFGTSEKFNKMLEETVLLCANCHRLAHFETGNWAPKRTDI